MHDYHAVEAVVARLTSAHLTDVVEVRIRAGAAFSPVALRQAYEMLTLGTPLHGSHLLVEPMEDECPCPACGEARHITCEDLAGHLVVCPSCGTPSPIDGLSGIEVTGISSSAASSPHAGT